MSSGHKDSKKSPKKFARMKKYSTFAIPFSNDVGTFLLSSVG